MSRWGTLTVSLVALVFLTLPLLMAQASRSGRMTRWDERTRRWDERVMRAAGWTPPWWYPPAVACTFLLLGLVVWLMGHNLLFSCVVMVQGIPQTIAAVMTRRQVRRRGQHDGPPVRPKA
jgi:hypothetical protein